MATPGTPSPAEAGPRRLWLIAVLFGLLSSVVLGATVVLVTRSSEGPSSVATGSTLDRAEEVADERAFPSTTATSTTVAAPADRPPVAPGRVVIVGDSITEQSQDTFEEVLGGRWSLWIDGVGGATVAQQMPAARRAVDQSPEQVVVELGTNDVGRGLDPATSVALVREMLDLFPGATCLHVVSVTEGMSLDGRDHRADAIAFNEGLRGLAAADPRLTVVEWDAALADAQAATGASFTDFVHDTVHLTVRGERLLADSIATALDACPT